MNKLNSMPKNTEAEQALLGAVLLDQKLQGEIISKLTEDDFYEESNKTVFKNMQSIFLRNKPVDMVTLLDEAEKNNNLSEAGGTNYLINLSRVTPSAANYNYYLEIVKRDSILRKLIAAAKNIIEDAYKGLNAEEAVAAAEKEIYDISAKLDTSDLTQINAAFNEVISKFDAISKDKNAFKGVMTGYVKLDDITNGLHKGDLILIAARPGMGKTSLGMNIIEHAALFGNAVCAVFSLEMPRVQIAQRMLCSIANVNMSDALKGKLKQQHWKELYNASSLLSKSKIFVDDSSLITPAEILSKCRRLKSRFGLDLIMIDYIQLMGSGNKKIENRQQEISEISRNLKIIAKEIDVPLIALSQLSRAVESRAGHKPVLSDLRESGAIEQDADIVMFIHRPDLSASDSDIMSGKVKKGVAEINIAKHRNGALGTIELFFRGESTKFVNILDSEIASVYNIGDKNYIKAAKESGGNAGGANDDIPFDNAPEQDLGPVNENIDELFKNNDDK